MKFKNIILIAVLAMLLVSCAEKKEDIKTVEVTVGSIKAELPTTGVVEPRNRLEIKPPISGRIEEVLIREGQWVKKGQILGWMSSNERAALLDAARAKGKDELAKWQDVYKPTPVVAPLNGFVIQRAIEPGQMVTSTDALLVMADYLIVNAQVDETDIGSIKINQPVGIELDAYMGKEIPGKVGQIAYESQVINNVNIYEVKVAPDYVPDYFRSGMSATINFVQEQKENVLLLPLSAVVEQKGKSYVLLQDKDQKIKSEQITTGLENTMNVEIITGLKEGQKVVVPNADLIKKHLKANQGRRGPINPFSKKK